MSLETENLFRAIMALSEDERWDLIERVMETDHPTGGLDFDLAWLAEARLRASECESGLAEPASWTDVRERVRRRLEGRSRE